MIALSFLASLDTESLKNINLLIGCFFFAFTGSYLQEISNIYNGKQRVTKIHKVVIGTIIGMGFYLFISTYFFKHVGVTLSVALNVLSGLLGYEVFNRCSSIEGLKKTSKDINEIVQNLIGIKISFGKITDSDDDKDDKSKKDKHD